MPGGPPAQLEVGYVARAHGLRGEVAVKCFDPGSETLLEVEQVVLRPRGGEARSLAVVSARPASREILLVLEGVEGRSAAEELVGAAVLVAREDAGELGEGEYFQGDLVGLSAVEEGGAELGAVVGIQETGGVPNLIIRGGRRELLVPFADEFVPRVDLEGRRVVIRPAGLEG